MANFLLIHGACHGGWCWERVTPLLEAAGHSVVAPDLPGHGADTTRVSELSLKRYGEFVSELAASNGPVVLVGHSMAGAVISRAAEAVPDQIERLVYLTAYLPQSGVSLASLARRDMETATASERVEIDGVECFTISRDAARRAFYQDVSDADFETAMARIGPEPVSIFREKAVFTKDRFDRVPRVYIHCTQDKAIGYTLQREMVRDTPCASVLTLESGHSPFVTMPQELAEALLSLSE
jgi:pimeloyl-ACP methyl ester carboxylesterase